MLKDIISGNALVVAGTTGCTIALTWGGITAPWGSAQVLVPLILGIALLGFFLVWEAVFAKHPLVGLPFRSLGINTP